MCVYQCYYHVNSHIRMYHKVRYKWWLNVSLLQNSEIYLTLWGGCLSERGDLLYNWIQTQDNVLYTRIRKWSPHPGHIDPMGHDPFKRNKLLLTLTGYKSISKGFSKVKQLFGQAFEYFLSSQYSIHDIHVFSRKLELHFIYQNATRDRKTPKFALLKDTCIISQVIYNSTFCSLLSYVLRKNIYNQKSKKFLSVSDFF